MSQPLFNAYRVTMRLHEEGERPGFPVQVVTVATSVVAAATYVQPEMEEADGPMEKGFEWVVTAVEKIEGTVAIPARQEKIAPQIQSGQ